MRFAYIDSNGNEVPIPSVDALALRIELGAISEETQLYDAQADQWGPAHTHEIYHTLARASESDEGFIAPPPVGPPPVAAPAPVEPSVTEPLVTEPPAEEDLTAAAIEEPEAVVPETSEPLGAVDLGLTLAEPPEIEDGEDSGLDLDLDLSLSEGDDAGDAGLTLADPSPDEGVEVADDEDASALAMDFGGMDLAPALDEVDEAAPLEQASPDPAVAAPVGDDPAPEAAGMFDFGGMEGGLELEEEFEPPVETPPMDLAGGATEEPVGDFGGEMELETAMDFGSGGFAMEDGGALDLETPMSEFSPQDPPSWMGGEGESTGQGEVLDFSAVGGESEADVPLRDRRTPKNKPSAPKRPRRSLTGPLIGAVVVVAIGVGFYAAWPVVSDRLRAGPEDAEQAVFIPPISAELMPQMRAAAEASLAAAFGDVRQEWASGGAVVAPPTDWLAGIYLARASEYEEVEVFWNGMGDLLDGARGLGLPEFDAAFTSEMASRGVSAVDTEMMRARADSGFVAAAEAREATYVQLEALVDAALRLHQFLVANEANIEYVPASTVTTDPVLEVNPASDEIGDAMGDLIEAVTDALGALGYRDQVTADGLWGMVLQRVQDTGIQ
jgi:hypothetical protein